MECMYSFHICLIKKKIFYRKDDKMKYPKYTDYEKMYKRYFDKGVSYLIEKADFKDIPLSL